MFTTEFEAEIDESESATLHHYYREAMTQGYNFAFEVKKKKKSEFNCGKCVSFCVPACLLF